MPDLLDRGVLRIEVKKKKIQTNASKNIEIYLLYTYRNVCKFLKIVQKEKRLLGSCERGFQVVQSTDGQRIQYEHNVIFSVKLALWYYVHSGYLLGNTVSMKYNAM